MAVIFYGIQGEGLGHATRSKTIIEHLSKKNEIHVFCGGRAFQYMTKHYNDVHRITSPHIFYAKNRASNIRTFFLNLVKVPHFILSYFVVRRAFREKRPDMIITDFEPITNYFGLLHGIPTVSVDNQHVISKSDVDYPRRMKDQYVKTKIIVKLMIWKARRYFMINFFFPEVKYPNCYFVRPIIRKEIQRLRPGKKDFVLVYQTSFTDTHLVPSLLAAGEKTVVYGYPQPGVEGNIRFREFNETEFFHDLKNCKAVITNGGQSLICEAIFLKKPVLSVPVKNQFEQYVNAEYIERLGFGEFHENINSQIIRTFLSRLPVYRKNLEREKMIGNKELFTLLDRTIREFSAKKERASKRTGIKE
jgi:uncharacterized protein (TIGR00661 family)